MKAQTIQQSNILEAAFEEFNGHCIYGLEFILDELHRQKPDIQPVSKEDDYDWFGLSDLCI